MQDELHHSRVRARLRTKALRTRSKSQNKVLLLRIVALLDSFVRIQQHSVWSLSLCSPHSWREIAMFKQRNSFSQAAAGPGTEAEVNSWWKTPRPPPCSLSPILTLRLQTHSSKMTLQRKPQACLKGCLSVGAGWRQSNAAPWKRVCVVWLAAADKVESWEAQNSQTVQEDENLGDKYYNKAKCFFDNISSDLKPRWGKVLHSLELSVGS